MQMKDVWAPVGAFLIAFIGLVTAAQQIFSLGLEVRVAAIAVGAGCGAYIVVNLLLRSSKIERPGDFRLSRGLKFAICAFLCAIVAVSGIWVAHLVVGWGAVRVIAENSPSESRLSVFASSTLVAMISVPLPDDKSCSPVNLKGYDHAPYSVDVDAVGKRRVATKQFVNPQAFAIVCDRQVIQRDDDAPIDPPDVRKLGTATFNAWDLTIKIGGLIIWLGWLGYFWWASRRPG